MAGEVSDARAVGYLIAGFLLFSLIMCFGVWVNYNAVQKATHEAWSLGFMVGKQHCECREEL